MLQSGIAFAELTGYRPMSKIDPDVLSYEGCDLEAMSVATRYYAWLIDIIKPQIGKRVVEVGAGSGSFSKQLLHLKPEVAIFVEPTTNMFKLLEHTVKEHKQKGTKTYLHNAFMNDVEKKLEAEKPDTFIYVNVFEHIEDDVSELKTIKRILAPGGHAIIFVPALQVLLSDFDKSIGHYRRYTRKTLAELAEKAGLEVVHMRYMDMVGVATWWINFKLMRRRKLSPKMIEIYDRYFVPLIRAVESRVKVPVGKNILLIARKKPHKKR